MFQAHLTAMNAKLHPVLPVETAKLAMSGTGLLVPFVSLLISLTMIVHTFL